MLTEKQKRELEKLDFSMGGGFYNFASTVHKAEILDDYKFLFIGLGGRGVKTVSALKTAIAKTIDMPEGKIKPDNVEYLVFDTADNDMEQYTLKGQDNIGLEKDVETCSLYDGNAAQLLKDGGKISETILSWMNPRLVGNADLTGKGAGGIRQAARFSLFSPEVFDRVQKNLDKKITDLHSLKFGMGKFVVYVLAGLGGGSGSGIFLDIPYIIREIWDRKGYPNQDLKIQAYLYLPDSYDPKETRDSKPHIQYNSYAALKELDYYMGLPERNGGYYEALYPGAFTIRSKEAAFDVCNLVTGSIKGAGQIAEPEIFSRRVVLEHLLHLITKSDVGGGPVKEFLIDSFLDNAPVMIANAVQKLDQNIPRNALYKYNVIGIGVLDFPLEQILAYVSAGVMAGIEATWMQTPSSDEIDEMIKILPLHVDTLCTRISEKMETGFLIYRKGMLAVKKEDCINGVTDALGKNLLGTHRVDFYKELDRASNQVLETVLQGFKDKLEQKMVDADRGLFFCLKLLDYEAGRQGVANGLLQRIRTDLNREVEGLIAGANQQKNNIKVEKQRLRTKLSESFGAGRKKVEEYVELCIKEANEDLKIDMYNKIGEKLKEFRIYVESQVKMLQSFTDSFYGIKEILERNYIMVMNGQFQAENYRVSVLNLHDEDEKTKRVIEYLNKLINEMDYRGLVSRFARKMLDNVNYISTEENYNPMRVYVRFIEEEFNDIPQATIEKFITLKYGNAGFAQAVTDICNSLKAVSQPVFTPWEQFTMSTMCSKSFISAPAKAVNLFPKIQNYAVQNGATIAASSDMNSIVWYNLYCGIPLFALKNLTEYEKSYEEPATKPGRHRDESGNTDWIRFPNLCRPYFGSTDNPREEEIADEIHEITERMLSDGIIEGNTAGDCITYNDVQIPVMSEFPKSEKENNTLKRKTEEFFQEYKSNPDHWQEGKLIGGGRLYRNYMDAVGKKDCFIYMTDVQEQGDRAGLERMLRLNWTVYLQIKQSLAFYEKIELAIEAINNEADEARRRSGRRELFLRYLLAGYIWKEDDYYYFKNEDGQETELLFFDDLNGLDRLYELYFVFDNFMERVPEETLNDELTQAVTDTLKGMAKADRTAKRKEYHEICREKTEHFKKAKTLREFREQGKEESLEGFRSFYTELGRLIGPIND